LQWKIEGIEGVAIFLMYNNAGPTIEIIPDQVKLAQFGISPASFQFQTKTINGRQYCRKYSRKGAAY